MSETVYALYPVFKARKSFRLLDVDDAVQEVENLFKEWADGVSVRGVYSTVGYGGMISVPSVAMVVGESTIAGNLVGSWIDLWELLQLHGRGEITLRTETHSLDDVNDVLDALRDGEITGRAVLVP